MIKKDILTKMDVIFCRRHNLMMFQIVIDSVKIVTNRLPQYCHVDNLMTWIRRGMNYGLTRG